MFDWLGVAFDQVLVDAEVSIEQPQGRVHALGDLIDLFGVQTLIVNSVNAATASVKALAPSKLARRQAAGLQAALTTLLTEINGIAETLVTDLG